ncbi:alpha/beta fold hydrolase [Pedococcus sp. 5OH_020]|uniref:alpha/beta fold hydrolase n=1 Tax=Pedococcus sp. 5OH_020 TaxID=2989814 RepID=UPI0022E9DE65|nr:alpha/beta fold hydrolase [Pedococcus sp. 5OH_020]
MQEFTRDGLVFDVTDSGPRTGEVVVLLHGWPQDRTAWDEVTPLLLAGGLRVVSLDQRGYSPRARPPGRSAYRTCELVGDVRALVDALGVNRVHLVGHDWGGAVAWLFAERHPERLSSLVVLSTPHHQALAWATRHSDQLLRSGYIAAFQVPLVPEWVLSRILPRLLTRSGLPAAKAARYAARFRDPGFAAGSLAWYRALPLTSQALGTAWNVTRHREPDTAGTQVRIEVPTTYLWGRHDPSLGRAAAERTAREVAAPYEFVELEAGHWLPETRPHEVASAVLRRAGATPGP